MFSAIAQFFKSLKTNLLAVAAIVVVVLAALVRRLYRKNIHLENQNEQLEAQAEAEQEMKEAYAETEQKEVAHVEQVKQDVKRGRRGYFTE